jgi:dephospho-CoA kinase
VKSRPYVIGLTGNIATGKSEVARILAGLGAYRIDADGVAHQVMEPDGPAYGAVVEAFGPDMLAPDGTVDRSKLAGVVFRDSEALRRLEAIVHPSVMAEVDRRIREASEPVIVVEAIKLIESGMYRHYDVLWVVTASREAQIARLMAARGLTAEEATVRVDAQPPQEAKIALADQLFVNDGSLDELHAAVSAAWLAIQTA